ncbi:glycosyltransferase family 2 protein [Pseudocnuella soli]|uniref:glycosyltransferase family 2 protein n=1 Tax=Pseudocnuella soli TaxID=2502779 RepID=UPI00104337CC|nr:glycosyltransferase family 2 protein [Pseudocnuella soli]
MKFKAYHIAHLYFDQPLEDFPLATESNGQYVVYWWKDIPLGHTYFEAGSNNALPHALPKIVASISEAIQFYTGKQAAEWSKPLLQNNWPEFQSWLQQALDQPEQNELPQSVPVSVVICTRNRAAQLANCLVSLATQRVAPQEIIVVDNAPSDNSTAEVAARFPDIRYIRESKTGLDIARNTGALAASYPVIAYTDDDVKLHPLWTYRIWQAFEESPRLAALTGLVIATELKTEAQLIFEKFWSFNRGYVDKVYGRDFFEGNLRSGPPVWEIGAGANMAFRKTAFEQVGYFDELLDAGKAGCNGDSEIWFRILNHGLEINYNPRVIAFHEHRRTMAELKRQMFHYLRGFTVAALLQQDRQPAAGYRRRLYLTLPRYNARRIIDGFPNYRFQYRTIGPEMRGMVSGFFYYLKNKKYSSIIPYNAK